MLTALLARGTQESAAFNNVIVVIKVAVVLAVIIFGAPYVDLSNWTPLAPENSASAFFPLGVGKTDEFRRRACRAGFQLGF